MDDRGQEVKTYSYKINILWDVIWGFPGGTSGKEPTCQCRKCKREMWVQSLGQEEPLEEGMATHSSILAWRIPMNRGDKWATVHGATVHVQSMGYSRVRVRHD